jgi:polysaccharide export outer membrane protein
MIQKFFISLSVLVSLIILTGCPKSINIGDYRKYQTEIDSLTIAALDPIIQKNDILSINFSVAGSENAQKLIQLYNLPANNTMNQAAQGFLVSPKGTISIPSLGEIEAAGKTKQELTTLLYQKLKKYVDITPVVTIRIINFRVFLEGEVLRPGAIEVLNEVLTLQQAIAMAGGTTLFATLNDVEIVRNDNGKQKIVHLDLRNDEIYTSKKEYFYLKQNDYISIKANKEKIVSSNQSAARTISYASTALTILLAMFTIFR